MRRLDVGRRWGFALTLLIVVWCATARAQPAAAPPPAGHTRAIPAQRVAAAPAVDGLLTEEAWSSAAAAEGFWVSDRQRPPSDQTRVVVLYNDSTLYVGFMCLDARPDLIRATQITRDGPPGLDDRVTVELDPHHNHRSVSRFTVTARGTQSDVPAGGRALKKEWKGEWQAAARRTPFGWTAELAIPLDLLEIDPGSDTFGINFSRYQHRTREWSEWADLTPRRLPEEAGHLTGLSLPEASAPRRLAVMQYVSSQMSAAADGSRFVERATGVDARYQWGGTMTSMLSARPDFSGTDADVRAVGFSHTERFVSDRRPFFQEGSAFFGDREIFHSGRIEDFDVGVKTFGRVDGYQVGVLATTDAGAGRADYVGRVVREIGPTFNMSATLAGTHRETIGNNTLQLQAGGRLWRNVRVEGNIARASSSGTSDEGTRRRAEIAYERAHWYSGGWADHTDPSYVAPNGFIAADLIGTSGRGAYGGYNRAFGGSWMRSASASASYDVRDTTAGLRQREIASVYAGGETASNVRLNAGVTVGSYRPRGAAQGRWRDELSDDRFYLASAFYESPTGQFGYGAQYSWGVAGVQAYDSLAPSLWLAPGSHVSFTYSFERASYDQVRHQHVVSGTWEISGAQALAARWVDDQGGYYRVSYRHALARSVDAFGVYTTDPYDPGRLNVKLVWTLSRFSRSE
jgi:hypothetical protein